LEARNLLAANVTAMVKNDVLQVEGTDNADAIYLTQQDGSNDVWVGSSEGAKNYGSFRGSAVKSIKVLGLGGKDVISLDGIKSGNPVRVNATIWGDSAVALSTDGNDVIFGGAGNDTINGGGGADKIYGRSGIDTIYGQKGNDVIYGGRQADSIYGGEGDDKLYGDQGIDWLSGGSGDDYLHGGDLVDNLDGGSGVNTYRRNLLNSALSLNGDEQGNMPAEVAGAFITDDNTEDSMYDIDQTKSPTCAFLATLASVARKTGSSNDLVQKIQYDAGRDEYGITLYKHGTRTEVILGVTFAFETVEKTVVWVNGDWTEGRDPGGRLWVTLYQKAYLQLLNASTRDSIGACLESTQWKAADSASKWNNVRNCIFALTGRDSGFVKAADSNAKAMAEDLASSSTFGLIASTLDTGTKGGIVANHCYTVLSVYKDANGTWQVRLRNPWAQDGSDGAMDDIQSGKPRLVNDGLVTITWSQFAASFRGYYAA
jgi:hypothetical protein